MPDVMLKDVSKVFSGGGGIRNISLNVPSGSLVCIIGPSGSGKTTLLRVIAGLDRADCGEILSNGSSITHLPALRRSVSMVFQQPRLFPHLSVAANIALPLTIRNRRYVSLISGRLTAEQARIVESCAAVLHIQHLLERRPATLSGGETQRVALARALVADSAYLLLDEPLAAVDERQRFEFQGILEKTIGEARSAGRTVLYVTHDIDEARALADQIVVLIDGRVAQVGTPRELHMAPASIAVARFLARCDLVVLSGTVVRKDRPDVADIEIPHPAMRLSVSCEGVEIVPGMLVQVCFRRVFLRPETNQYAVGSVISMKDIGTHVRVRATVGNTEITTLAEPMSSPLSNPALVVRPEDAFIISRASP